jgi:hypothetical protein
MCKELAEELARGEKAFEDLAAHLLAMGANNMAQTVRVDGVRVYIQVERKE